MCVCDILSHFSTQGSVSLVKDHVSHSSLPSFPPLSSSLSSLSSLSLPLSSSPSPSPLPFSLSEEDSVDLSSLMLTSPPTISHTANVERAFTVFRGMGLRSLLLFLSHSLNLSFHLLSIFTNSRSHSLTLPFYFRHLVVVDNERRAVGMLTRKDFIWSAHSIEGDRGDRGEEEEGCEMLHCWRC